MDTMDIPGFKSLCKETMSESDKMIHIDDFDAIYNLARDIRKIDSVIERLSNGIISLSVNLANLPDIMDNSELSSNVRLMDYKVSEFAKTVYMNDLRRMLRSNLIEKLRVNYKVVYE